jgi:hypothetical protein
MDKLYRIPIDIAVIKKNQTALGRVAELMVSNLTLTVEDGGFGFIVSKVDFGQGSILHIQQFLCIFGC